MENVNESSECQKNIVNPVPGYDLFNQQYERSLDSNREEHDNLAKHKAELSSVRTHLETLPNELSYDVMIPIGSQGLMRGKMVHTNEILALVGDNWYVKTSAKHASEICQRRIERCDMALNECEKERGIINTWRETTREVFQGPDGDAREIYEEYDEEKEKEWRELHRENVRKHYGELAKLRMQENKTVCDDEEALRHRLEELERREEMEDELIRSGEDLDGCSTDSEDDKGNEIDDGVCQRDSLTPSGDDKPKRRVSFSNMVEEVVLETETEKEPNPEPLMIYFQHSNIVVKSSEENFGENVSQSTSELASPSDVYTHYASLFSPTPKSILKQRSPSIEGNGESNSGCFIQERPQSKQLDTGIGDPDDKNEEAEDDQEQPQPVAFSDVVVEHNPQADVPVPENPAQGTKPVSRFKASRQKQKNK